MKYKKVISLILLGSAILIGTSIIISQYSTPITASSESRLNNLVVNDKDISQSGGTYQKSWSQPNGWSYYGFSVANTTATSITIQIQEHGNVKTYSLAAGKANTWSGTGVPAGLHTIVILTADGRKFTGDVAVRISDTSL